MCVFTEDACLEQLGSNLLQKCFRQCRGFMVHLLEPEHKSNCHKGK